MQWLNGSYKRVKFLALIVQSDEWSLFNCVVRSCSGRNGEYSGGLTFYVSYCSGHFIIVVADWRAFSMDMVHSIP